MSDPQQPEPAYENPGPPPPLPPAPQAQHPAPHAHYPAPHAPYAAPYTVPQHPQYAAAVTGTAPIGTRTLGLVALILALAALVVTPVAAAIASFAVGLGAGKEIAMRPTTAAWDWSVLSPVRDHVLLGEFAFWGGTILGIWAIVQGIVAIVGRRGRGYGIAAVIIAVIAPIVFGVAAFAAFSLGVASGSSIGG